MNNVTTHSGEGFNERVNAIANRLVYGVPVDPDSDPYEVVAAKLVLRWELENKEDN